MADSTTSIDDDIVTAALVAVGAVGVAAVLALWWALRHPRTTLVVAVPVAVALLIGLTGAVIVLAGFVGVGVAWRRGHRESFDWFFLGPWQRA